MRSSTVALQTLLDAGTRPDLVVTLPESARARHSDWADVAALASAAGLEVLRSADVNDEPTMSALRAAAPDYLLVVGWSQLFRAPLLALPARGCIGFHPSLLPLNRGRAVIPWTILQRTSRTGGSLLWLDEGMDSGDLLAQREFDVADDETADTLYDKHVTALAEMLRDVLPTLDTDAPPRSPQDHTRATWCAKRTADDGQIDWRRPAQDVWDLVRASTTPYPGAFTSRAESTLTIWSAALVDAPEYVGLPGQVQRVDADAVLVQCGDGRHLALGDVELDGIRLRADEALRLHERLGVAGVTR